MSFTWWTTGARRSPYVPDATEMGLRTALDLEQIWTAPVTVRRRFSAQKLYTQWPSDSPKKGQMGDPVFDNFIKGQMQFVSGKPSWQCPQVSRCSIRSQSPVILITHSQGGGSLQCCGPASKPGRGHGSNRTRGPADRGRGHVKVAYTGKIGNAWGITICRCTMNPGQHPRGSENISEEKSERPDEVPCLYAEGTGPQAHRMQNIRIPLHLRRGHLSPHF